MGKLIAMLLMIYALAGCAILNPNVPYAQIEIQAAKYLNPDINSNPSPVVLIIYQLKSLNSFNKASYMSITNQTTAALGKDLIDQETIEIRPGENKTITSILSINTRYLGFVAAYRSIDQANWRTSISVPAQTMKFSTLVSLESSDISLRIKHESSQ